MMSLQIVILCCLIAAILLTFAFLRKGKAPTQNEWRRYTNLEKLTEEQWLYRHLSDQHEEAMLRQCAREANCTVEQLCRCGYAAKAPGMGEGDLCVACFCQQFESIALDVYKRAKELFEVHGMPTEGLLNGEPITITCSSFAKFVTAVRYLRGFENITEIAYTLESGTEGVYDVFSWHQLRQEVVVEHHFLLEGCDWGDIDWSCYTYERWALEIAATLANA